MSRTSFGLPCPRCGGRDHRVLETRAPRRRRECLYCGCRFSTIEQVKADSPSAGVDAPTGRDHSSSAVQYLHRRDGLHHSVE